MSRHSARCLVVPVDMGSGCYRHRGITELTYELQRKKEGKGGSNSPKAAVEEVPNLFANDDDSDEDVELIAMV